MNSNKEENKDKIQRIISLYLGFVNKAQNGLPNYIQNLETTYIITNWNSVNYSKTINLILAMREYFKHVNATLNEFKQQLVPFKRENNEINTLYFLIDSLNKTLTDIINNCFNRFKNYENKESFQEAEKKQIKYIIEKDTKKLFDKTNGLLYKLDAELSNINNNCILINNR